MTDPPPQHPAPDATERRVARFGIFELDLTAGNLSRKGYDLGLQQQPALLLTYLVERAGQLVTREELRTTIWPSGTYVEFDLGLNTAISRLRRILGDSAGDPRYIETVPKQGYRFIAQTEFEPAPAAAGPTPRQEPAPVAPAAQLRLPRRAVLAGVAAALAILVPAAVLLMMYRPSRSGKDGDGGEIRYSLPLPSGTELHSLAMSPGGDQIVYEAATATTRTLYRRFLDEEQTRPIPATDGAEEPFFSPDGRELGFYTSRGLRIISGKGTRELAKISQDFDLRKAFWGEDGFVYFTNVAPGQDPTAQVAAIFRVRSTGGTPELVLKSGQTEKGALVVFGQEYLHAGSPALLFSGVLGPQRRSISWCELRSGCTNATTLVKRGMGGQVLPTGHLLYYWRGSLMAARFDEQARTLLGSPVEVVSAVAANGWRGPRASVSRNGTLVYAKSVLPRKTLVWVSRDGTETPLTLPAAAYEQAEVSPDGTRLAIVRRDDPGRWTLWSYDLRSGAWTQLADCPVPYPRTIWSPDGRSLIASMVEGDADFVNLYRFSLDSTAKPERLTHMPDFGQYPLSWSAAANAVLFVEGVHPATQSDILLLPLAGGRQPRPLVTQASPDHSPTFSPDGRWFAYSSQSPDGLRVFAQPCDQSTPPQRISDGEGSDPLWAPDGKRVYYLGPRGSLVEVPVSGDTRFGQPRQVLPAGFSRVTDWWTRPYSLAPDGRLLVIRDLPESAAARSEIHVIVNWFRELSRLAP